MKPDFKEEAVKLFQALHLQDNWTDKIAAALEAAYERGFEEGAEAALLDVAREGL
jgi:hypothetical protein